MPLIRIVEDRGFVTQLEQLNLRNQFIREMASAILPGGPGVESVLSIANRVYDRYCTPGTGLLNSRRRVTQRKTALSA